MKEKRNLKREKWMDEYYRLCNPEQPLPQDFWDGATFKFNQGLTPTEAAEKEKKLRGWTTGNRAEQQETGEPTAFDLGWKEGYKRGLADGSNKRA